jgi:lipopolysaccharide export system permease protein
VQRKLENGQIDLIGFSNYVVELRGFADKNLELFYKPSDRFLPQLLNPDLTDYWDRDHVGDLLAEAHRRLAAPIICLSSVALAMLAVLGGSFSRQGYAARIGWAFGGLIFMLLSFTGLIPTVADQPALGLILYLIPLAVLIFCTRSMRTKIPGFVALTEKSEPQPKPLARGDYAH